MKVHIAYLVAIAVLLSLCGLIGYEIIQHVKADSERDAKIAQAESDNKTLQEQSQSLQKTLLQVQAQSVAHLAQLEAQRISVKTPEQAATVVHQETPLATVKINTLPDTPSSLSQPDVKLLADYALRCKECDVDRAAAHQELDLQKKLNDSLVQQNANLVIERDAAVKASKGGSAWQRTWRVIKVAGIAGAIGYALGKKWVVRGISVADK